MKFNDIVWGQIEVEDNEVRTILKHKSFKRLKRIWISTYGYLFEMKRNSTRFEHSLGVYWLLKHFGASKQEQIAGLIHDVSHTALSHVSTYAFLGKFTGQEFHELKHKSFLVDSGLEQQLIDLGYNPSLLDHEAGLTLLENDLPDICADRLDYAIRDGLHLQTISAQEAKTIIDGLGIVDSEFVFTNIKAAEIYANCFFWLNKLHYGSATEAHFNNDFGNLVKRAVELGVLEDKDWYEDDVYLTKKLKRTKNKEIKNWLGKYNNKLVVIEDNKLHDFIFPKKIRIVDPKVKLEDKTLRLTELSTWYARMVNEYKDVHSNHEMKVRILYKS